MNFKRISVIAFVAFAVAGFAVAQSVTSNQVDIGGGYYGTDITGVYANFQNATTNGQPSKYAPSANYNAKYTLSYKLDASNVIKVGAGYDGWYGFYTGNASGKAYNSGQNTGIISPFVEYTGHGADVVFSVPMYYFSTADASGYNEFKYAYSEAGYMPTNSTNYPLSSNNFLPSTEIKANYKYSFNKTTWLLAQIDTLATISPTFWLTFAKPKISFGIIGIQADCQLDYFNGYADASSNQYYEMFFEPKLTYDLGFAKFVPGLKLYTAAKLSLATTNPTYTVSSVAQNFHNSWIQPGVNYTLGFGSLGSFMVDAGWRFAKFDNVASVTGNNAGTYTGNSSPNAKDMAPYSELRVGLTYTYKF